jgi:hypothetical protein
MRGLLKDTDEVVFCLPGADTDRLSTELIEAVGKLEEYLRPHVKMPGSRRRRRK